MATDLFATRSQQNTPNYLAKTLTNSSQPAAESPLRKTSFPADGSIPAEVRRGRLSVSSRTEDHDAMDSEQEHEVHIEPYRRYNKITGGEESMNETSEVIGDEDGDFLHEHGYSVPILAADEVAKEVGVEYLQPAVSPKQERRGSAYELEIPGGDLTPGSRPSSRPTSMHGLHSAPASLHRFISHHDERESIHTPLEDVEEYEPLFPEEDDQKRPVSHAERFKQRPSALKQRFPSQDIWEDTPSSALYSATVSTPDLPSQAEKPATFETPEQEAARKEELSEEERKKLIPKEERLAKSVFAPHLRDDMPTRPGMVPRFPSSDIWEDSPESHHLVTTVNTPPVAEAEPESTTEAQVKPSIPQRPVKSRLGEGASTAQVAPSVPARPQKTSAATSPTELKKVPSIPDRPKPQIPARPAKKTSGDGLTKTASGESAVSIDSEKISPPIAKVKPQVPARPGAGSKIANLRGNFMNDLNQKLGLGPPKEKEPEPVVEEAQPLEDARKSRARGPQRRAPAAKSAAPVVKSVRFAMTIPRSLWTIDDTDELNLVSEKSSAPQPSSKPEDAITLSDKQAEQINNSTAVDAPLPSTVETIDHVEPKAEASEKRDRDEESAPQGTGLAMNTAGELADPTLEAPTREKSNPLSLKDADEDGVTLSQRTTASDVPVSGAELEREDPNPDIDAIPASRQTTASSRADTVPLEKTKTHEPSPLATEVPEGEPGKASAEEV